MKKTEKNTNVVPMNAPTTPENTPSVYDNKEFCADMKKHADNIKKELGKVESSFLKVAFDLHYIYQNKGYEVLGAKDIYSLAKERFGLARGTANNFINIVESFAKRDENGNILPELDERYKKFKSSQLIVMLNMSEDALLEVTSDMTVRQLKKMKSGETPEESEEPGEDAEIQVTEKEAPTRQTLITLHSEEDYNRNIDNIDTIILRALRAKDKTKDGKKYCVEISCIW